MLPSAFLERMERLLGPEFREFLASYDQPRTHSLRVNTLKLTPEELATRLGIPLEPVPWAPGGFYFPETERPGIHPYHAAGLYYIQEASAMAAAQALAPRPGERVLDLCAAPGGKSTHLAALMGDEGLLVTNEPHPKRARILAENLERFGVKHAIVFQEEPHRLAERFGSFFDRVLVDAPCSGEGMFRKLPEAPLEWTPEAPAACALRQEEILPSAVRMLKPGGYLLYSTCTFAPEENEQVLLNLLRCLPELRAVPLSGIPGASPAVAAWAGDATPEESAALGLGARLWPHKLRGEGHFMVLLQKSLEAPSFEPERPPQAKRRDVAGERAALESAVKLYRGFCSDNLKAELPGPYRLWGEALYQVSESLPELEGLRVVRPGLHLGDVKKNRFEPSHALALALTAEHFKQRRDLPADSGAVRAYLRGETLPADGLEGWTVITVDGYPLGWAKASAGVLKNHYPKGLRWQA